MIYYLSIVIGILLVFFAALRLLKVLKELSVVLRRFEVLTEGSSFAYLENLRSEMDELNYSYYEILDAFSERVDQVESSIKALNRNIPELSVPLVQIEKTDSDTQNATSERDLINRLFSQGFSDQDIAKIMSVGIGKVSLLRRLDTKKDSQRK